MWRRVQRVGVHVHALKPVWQVAWNYGANFGGPSKATWTSGANSLTAGSVSLHPMCAHANALLAPCTRSATLLARATLLNTQEWQRRANKVTPWLWL